MWARVMYLGKQLLSQDNYKTKTVTASLSKYHDKKGRYRFLVLILNLKLEVDSMWINAGIMFFSPNFPLILSFDFYLVNIFMKIWESSASLYLDRCQKLTP